MVRWLAILLSALGLAAPNYAASVVINCGSFAGLTTYVPLQNWPYDSVRFNLPWQPTCSSGFILVCSAVPKFVGANVRQSGSLISIDLVGSDEVLPPNVLSLASVSSPQVVSVDAGPLSPGTYTVEGRVYGITGGVSSDLCNVSQTLATVAIEKASATVARQTAIEFYSLARDHYFITTDAAEIASLDAGTSPGWSRTGKSFAVFAPGKSGGVGVPVCRFYGSPSAGLDSHFYTANADECSTLPSRFGGAWQLETSNAFEIRLPNERSECPAGFVPVYRLWNKRADSNHRFTTDLSVALQMRMKGWMFEAAVGDGASMCSPP